MNWAAKAQAIEAVGAANARLAASKEATLVGGLAELDDAVKRATGESARARLEISLVASELLNEEVARLSLASEMIALRVEMERRQREEVHARRMRNHNRNSHEATAHAALPAAAHARA